MTDRMNNDNRKTNNMKYDRKTAMSDNRRQMKYDRNEVRLINMKMTERHKCKMTKLQ